MSQSNFQESFNSIVILNEELCRLLSEKNIIELEKKIPNYTNSIESYFLKQQNQTLTGANQEQLEQLIVRHKKFTNLIYEYKEKISKSIKQLYTGREMQNTYP